MRNGPTGGNASVGACGGGVRTGELDVFSVGQHDEGRLAVGLHDGGMQVHGWFLLVGVAVALLHFLDFYDADGCAAPEHVGLKFCGHARPIYFDSAAQVDRTPVPVRRQLLESNEVWKRLCRKGSARVWAP